MNPMVILKSDSPLEVDPSVIAVVDAKSLFDHLAKESAGGKDRWTALEMAVIRQSLTKQQGKIRWIDHSAMIMDGLTKRKGNTAPLLKVMRTGQWRIVDETEEMEKRREQKALKGYIPRPHQRYEEPEFENFLELPESRQYDSLVTLKL
jgi:hypothetical protein